MERVGLFVDYQNVYRHARRAFFTDQAPHWQGQIGPRRLGDLLAARVPSAQPPRQLAFVRVYRGLPDGGRDPRGYAACSRQLAAWGRDPLVHPIARPLRYPANYPAEKATEKGIDVQLAVDAVLHALQQKCDAVVIFSADTDLKPAIEAIHAVAPSVKVEVAAWQPPAGHAFRLSVVGRRLWCHYLDRAAYDQVADPTDYAP